MNFNKDQVRTILNRMEALVKDPINCSLENGFRDYLDPDSDSGEIISRLQDTFRELIEFSRSGLNEVTVGGTEENDNTEDYELLRHPIFLSDNTCILITEFRSANSLSHMWLTDYVDYRKQQKVAAKDIIKQISSSCSVNLLWGLKEAIDEEIVEHNNRYGSKHPIDRPEGK